MTFELRCSHSGKKYLLENPGKLMLFRSPILVIITVLSALALQACGSDGVISSTEVTTDNGSDTDTGPIDTGPTGTEPTDTDPTETDPTERTIQVFEPSNLIQISSGMGGLTGALEGGDRFSRDHDRAGDINGDGIADLVVGARSDDDGASDAGAVYILFMNANGNVDSHQKISMLEGNFAGDLVEGNFFGYGVAGIGDYDGDDIPDIAVSAPAGTTPMLYILHLNTDGTVKSMVRNVNVLAFGLSAVGDLNQDGRIDLIAPDPNADNGGSIDLLFLDSLSKILPDATVTIGENMGGFGTGLNPGDSFGGRESAVLGDLDKNGTQELAVGAFESDGGLGAIWILSLDSTTNQVVDKLKIAPGLAGFNETIAIETNVNGSIGGHFGHALVAAGDLNGDQVPDLITSANQYNNGVGYILYLNPDKTVKTFTRINENEGGFDLPLVTNERFGRSISIVDDSREDGGITVLMGGGAGTAGVLYTLDYQACTYEEQEGEMFWSDGTTLFSNWNHGTQTVTGPLSFEQCAFKASENDGLYMTAKESDGRCIIKDSSAILSFSDEGSSAYIRNCP